MQGDAGDEGSIPGSGRSPGGGDGNPLQYSQLENLVGRGAWWAIVHSITVSRTRPKGLRTHARTYRPELRRRERGSGATKGRKIAHRNVRRATVG